MHHIQELALHYRAPGPHETGMLNEEWHDAARDRLVPVKLHFPKGALAGLPLIVFSHGLGGSRASYAYLGRHWASHGYVSVHVQHKGSDSEVWEKAKGAMADLRAAAQDPANVANRPLDIRFAIDQLHQLNRHHPQFAGRFDLERIGAAGHSFGGFTTLAVAGLMIRGPQGDETSLADPRVKAMIAMSPPGPKHRELLERTYGRIRIPGLHMTGTRDTSPIGLTDVADRRVPFDRITAADQYLVVLHEGDHMVFAGMKRQRSEKDAVQQELIRLSTTAFWEAYLRGDPAALAWLAGSGLQRALDGHATFEARRVG